MPSLVAGAGYDETQMMTPRPPSPLEGAELVDLFAGPGGLDVAAHWLGLRVSGVEFDKNACATRQAAGLKTEQGDVRAYGPKHFPNATVLAGGPPCQTYTLAGSGSGRRALDLVIGLVDKMAARAEISGILETMEDERTGLVLEPLRWALEAIRDDRPYKAIVLEQVPSVLPVWEAVGEALKQYGYGVDHGILRAEQFGVPQTRRRAVLVARHEHDAALPEPTHRPYRKGVARHDAEGLFEADALKPWVTIADALGSEKRFTVVSNYGSGGNPRNRGRRRSDEPAATVTGKVTRNRLVYRNGRPGRLTLNEAGQLQTFPEDYPWTGTDVAQQIGNAIPPRLAAHVLGAATGATLDEAILDAAVNSAWSRTRLGVPGLCRALKAP